MKGFNDWLAYEFGIDRNTSATILITLIVFISGGILAAVFEYIKTSFVRRTRRRLVRLNIDDLSKLVGAQSNSYLKFTEQLKGRGNEVLVFLKSDFSQITNLKEIGYENVFDAFFPWSSIISFNARMRRKAFNKLWQNIEVISYWQRQASEDYIDYLKMYNEFNEKRNEAISGLKNFLDPIIVSVNRQVIDKGMAEYITKVVTIDQNWQKQENRTLPAVVHNCLVSPLQKLNRQLENRNSISVEMNRFLLAASLHL